jgi:hypothetical protein
MWSSGASPQLMARSMTLSMTLSMTIRTRQAPEALRCNLMTQSFSDPTSA